MTWTLNIQSALNGIGGVRCALIYFTGNHFTVPVTLTREKTQHLEGKIRLAIEKNKQAGYNYTVQYFEIIKP